MNKGTANDMRPAANIAVAKEDLSVLDGTDNWSVPASVRENPLFVEVGTGSMLEAIRRLATKMRELGVGNLLTDKTVHSVWGKQVNAGEIGLFDYNGRPSLATKPGCYWNFNWAIKWSEALVVLSPSNKVFIIRNGGFCAYGAEGRFRILDVVDTLDLGDRNRVLEPLTGRVLGWKREVKSTVKTERGPVDVTVASFYNVPANNSLVIQRGNAIFALGAGQHVITDPHTTYRGFYSLCERQHQFATQPSYTLEGVPVILHVNLRYRVVDPVALTTNYEDPLQALLSPAQIVVNSIVSRLSYQQFMKAKKVSGDIPDVDHVPWVEAFKTECLTELSTLAAGHGIVVESFDVMDRELQGSLGQDLEKQAEKVLKNQIDATQVELSNMIARETQRGVLAVEQVKADVVKTKADADVYGDNRRADAQYYSALKIASAQTEASRLITTQEALNIVQLAEARAKEIELQAAAYAAVPSGHAQIIQLARLEVEKRKAMPASSVWFEGQGNHEQSVREGFGVATGVSLAGKR